jgi:hypothetical protein
MANLLEHFPGRFISEIEAELDRLPVGWLDEVLEAKGYQQAKQMTEDADTAEARKRLPTTPLFRLVSEIDHELARRQIRASHD